MTVGIAVRISTIVDPHDLERRPDRDRLAARFDAFLSAS